MKTICKILNIKALTHDVLQIRLEKKEDFEYLPGQVADISINKDGWENELRAFTFTSLPEDNYLEFSIKLYPSHNGVTNQIANLKVGDELIINGVFGDIQYKGDGIFIAGGAGVTPFIAIFKKLKKENKIGNNKLIFANKTKSDIILEDWFKNLLGKNFVNILSHEKVSGYDFGFINEEIVKNQIENSTKYFYLCGPDPMMEAVEKILSKIGISSEQIVKEGF